MPPTYFDRSQNLQIHGDINLVFNGEPSQDDPSFLQVTQRGQSTNSRSRAFERGLQILGDNTAPSALYGYGHSFTGPQCHPGTGIAIQDHIFNWLDDSDGPIAMWMNGPVGIGKSAIAQTVAHLAAERDQLCSAFFFFRSDSTRHSTKKLVATLAYEMTQQMPRTLDAVCQTIAANQLIFSYPLDRQINDILLQPLNCTNGNSSERSRLIIIDGLDECLDTNIQQGIIQSFISCFLSASTSPFPQKLLIVSRPESHIASCFSFVNIRAHIKHLPLGSWDTQADIAKYLRDKLKEIRDTHPIRHHLPVIWPDEDSFRKLRQRAIGSFAYASSVIRFLASHKLNPKRALEDILSLKLLRNAAAFAELDALYRHILSSLDPDICFTVQKLLCLHLYSNLREIASLSECLCEEQSVIEIALVHVPSLVGSDKTDMWLHHKSFEEFLRDQERSKEYFVFSSNVASAVAPALSKFWLRPVNGKYKLRWAETMANNISGVNASICLVMNVHMLRNLVATRLPASMFDDELWHIKSLTLALQWRDRNSPYGPLYSEAFNVGCAWLRSHLDGLFRGLITLSDILDIISGDFPTPAFRTFDVLMKRKNAVAWFFWQLLRMDHDPLGFICGLFPDMNHIEICYAIVEKLLAIPRQHHLCVPKHVSYFTDARTITVDLGRLYSCLLRQNDAMTPKLCHQLEQLVSNGQKVLGTIPSQYMTSEHCIIRILYDEPSYLESTEELPNKINNPGVRDMNKLAWAVLAKATDNYIRKVHEKLDFPYISADVEVLYRSPPVKFEDWCWPASING